jgi:hypothetical protein
MDFQGSDTERIQKALDAAVRARGTCAIPWTGKPWVVDATLTVRPVAGDEQARLKVVGDPQWCLIDYRGPDGSDVFAFYGLKWSRVENVGVRVYSDRVTAFSLRGDEKTQSSSQNRFVQCQVTFAREAREGIGFWMGRGGNDHSGSVFDQCVVGADVPGKLQDRGHLARVAEAKHRGFVFTGGNNLAPTLRDCSATNCVVGFQFFKHGGISSGGSGAYVEASGTSACSVVFLVDGGFSFTAVGGRDELGGALLVHGDPKSGGRGTGAVAIRNRIVSDFRPKEGAAAGLTVPGEFVGLRSGASFLFEGLTVATGPLGEPHEPSGWVLDCNDPSKSPEVRVSGSDLGFPARGLRARSGAWKVEAGG